MSGGAVSSTRGGSPRAVDRRVDVEFDVTNLTDNVYSIAKESEATPIQYAMRRVLGGRLHVSF
jgi:hypothetical protein